MDLKKSLRELGLTKYEADAYFVILNRRITEASIIYKEAGIPFGKIYEILNILAGKGLIEVQNTRPKKYKTRKPKLAFENLLKEEREDMERNLQRRTNLTKQIENEMSKMNIKQPKEKVFWTTAVGDEIGDLMKSNFEEAEKELCILAFHKEQQTHKKQLEKNIPSLITEVTKATSRGVKVKALLSKEFALNKLKKFKKFNIPKGFLKNIELRIKDEYSSTHFTIIDSEKVVLQVDDPTDQNNILAMTKIWDAKLAKKLKDKFNEMWKETKPFKIVP